MFPLLWSVILEKLKGYKAFATTERNSEWVRVIEKYSSQMVEIAQASVEDAYRRRDTAAELKP